MQGLETFIQKFDRENGSDFIVERYETGTKTGWLIFPTGAKRETHPIGVSCPPPKDPFERARSVAYYWETKLNLAISEFQLHKQQLTARAKVNVNHSNSGIPPAKEELEKLKELRQKVRDCQSKLTEAKQAVEANKPERLKERQIISELNRQENQKFLSKLEKIEV